MGVHSFKEAAVLLGMSPSDKKYIDTHCHYESKKFDKNREEIIKKVEKCCEKVICVGTNTKENAAISGLCMDYDFIYGMYGYFPTFVHKLDRAFDKNADANLQMLLLQLEKTKCVGVGEIGLDYNWDSVGPIKGEKARELQKKWFKKQAEIAISKKMPVSIHSRDAEEDTIKILEELDGLKGVIHCFSYSPETAKFCTDKGLYLGIGGTSTYKSNDGIRQAIKEAPIDKILLETDAPYLSPEPVRRQINDSSHIRYVIENIAAIKGMSYGEVIEKTNENCKILYGFDF